MTQNEPFDTLLLRCADRAYNFAYRLVGNDSDAQDLVQEAFSRAFEHRDRYDPNRPLGAWVNRILHNVFLDSVRKYEHKHKVSLDSPLGHDEEGSWEAILPGHDEDPVQRLIKNEEEERLQMALDKLPLHYKSAVVLADIEEMPYEDISKVLNIPLGTVCSRVHQGRSMLKKIFEKPTVRTKGK